VLLRNNTFSGVQYRSDPAILAWETGNELAFSNSHPPASWTLDVARHIKSLSPLASQLVIDGTHSKYGWPAEVFQGGDVDGFTGHYYPLSVSDAVPVGNWVGVAICGVIGISAIFLLGFHRKIEERIPKPHRRTFLITTTSLLLASLTGLALLAWHIYTLITVPLSTQFLNDMSTIQSRNASKLFFVGEFGLRPLSELSGLLAAVLAEPACLGALMWSLRSRSSKGGFFTHKEQDGYAAYHWPGLPGNPPGFPADSVEVNDLVRTYAARIRGVGVEELPVPGTPTNLAVSLNGGRAELRWRGSTGARQYSIERGPVAGGNWTVLASGVLETQGWEEPGFVDPAPVSGVGYRVRAENEAGESGWSAVAR
jgi:hypothetical protein